MKYSSDTQMFHAQTVFYGNLSNIIQLLHQSKCSIEYFNNWCISWDLEVSVFGICPVKVLTSNFNNKNENNYITFCAKQTIKTTITKSIAKVFAN